MTAMLVAGVDEAGRGPLAGPVIAAAVILDSRRPIAGLADSKALTPLQRERLDEAIRANALAWAIGRAEVEEIDTMNILHATLLAMRRAVCALTPAPLRALIDGNCAPQLHCEIEMIVKGDATVPAISAASILAKVSRDAEMRRLEARFPGYGFAAHKGYATREHLRALDRIGICPAHRRSFEPVRVRAAR